MHWDYKMILIVFLVVIMMLGKISLDRINGRIETVSKKSMVC